MKNKLFSILSILTLIGILSCTINLPQDKGIGGKPEIVYADAGIDSDSPDASDPPCPSATKDGCSRCTAAYQDPSQVSNLCQNFNGIPGGLPSEWIYESTVTCICSGDCSDICQSACSPDPLSQFKIDQTKMTPDCDTCIHTQAHSSKDPHGCGSQWSLCQLDL